MFNPAKASEEIKKDYIGYISTTFHFKNPILQDVFLKKLDQIVSNGPFVEIKDSFRSGKSIQELIDANILSPLFNKLESKKPFNYRKTLPTERPLYLHQEEAITKIVNKENIVVSTGTGSGKTYCFLIPVINELLREIENGTLNDGVRAMFIYPMNALANDQIKGLREILMNYPEITFGVYNGGTENNEADAIKLYEAMYENEKYPELRKRLPNEKLSRDDMKKHPPHILFTNYAMLEHMLFRPGDDAIFTNSNFKYVVLDEGHVYAGATGIETAFLIGRLKARVSGNPQFIITSATLGDGTPEVNKKVITFAKNLTGCSFESDSIVTAKRIPYVSENQLKTYSGAFYVDLANSTSKEELFLKDILAKYGISTNQDEEEVILFDILYGSYEYSLLRQMGSLLVLEDIKKALSYSDEEVVAFIALCAKARKNGKALVDIRYHYFLRALDGCYISLDQQESLSLIRMNYTETGHKMFEIALCDDCGEIALVGKTINGKLERASSFDEDKEWYQIKSKYTVNEIDQEEDENTKTVKKRKNVPLLEEYVLCKKCGAITPIEEMHNKWCDCKETEPIRLIKLTKENCSVCGGTLRRFNLGFEAATGVIATSLYEQIPEYTYYEDKTNSASESNPFLKNTKKQKSKETTGSQFLVFSDSRQGAAKFACFLGDSYKEFLRRRGIWNVIDEKENEYPNGIEFDDFRKLLENYYSSHKLFRESNDPNASSSIVENKRNSWIALLNELYNSSRRTSLISLGKISFDYQGNTSGPVESVANAYNISVEDAKALLDYLVFDIVRSGAITTDSETDINDEDRKYLYYSSIQQEVTKNKHDNLKYTKPWLPTARQLKDGTKTYYQNNKLTKVKEVLQLEDEEAVKFIENYWGYLISKDANPYPLVSKDGKGYTIPAKSFLIKMGKNATVFKCQKCGTITQFNILGKCIQTSCNGKLERLDGEQYIKENYYANLYKTKRISPLFIKEHTAQLDKKSALDYQQQFVRKEINALSCSTTFEMGVDVGDLETVFLRNIPPMPSNYAQRVGRAGRSIDAAAFALTYARLSSHDFTYFDSPQNMIKGVIYPPQFKLENEKIIRRHIYAVALSHYFSLRPDLYDGNKANKFVNEKGYVSFLEWLKSCPQDLLSRLENSFPNPDIQALMKIQSFGWLDEFCGPEGIFTDLITKYEQDVNYLQKEIDKAFKAKDSINAEIFNQRLNHYTQNNLIDLLVRGNILPKYGFPIDSVELTQNIASKSLKSLNLTRDLAVAISEYAPSAEVIADGGLYTSRYIKKPFVNHKVSETFDIAYIAECPKCNNTNYKTVYLGNDTVDCIVCGHKLTNFMFKKSIQPRAGFIAEKDVKPVPLSSQEKKYRTEAIYIGDKSAEPIKKEEYVFGETKIEIESTTNDSLAVKSLHSFYVCDECGYAIAEDEQAKLEEYKDYKYGVSEIKDTPNFHETSFGKGKCSCKKLKRYYLHHEFKTDVAKISFSCDTSYKETMLSVMYALLNAFATEMSIERKDIKACLTYKQVNGVMTHKIIIYDSVPGGAGHSRRLVEENVLKQIIDRAYSLLNSCKCEPSCYRCLRSYENQKIHELLDRQKAMTFLKKLI